EPGSVRARPGACVVRSGLRQSLVAHPASDREGAAALPLVVRRQEQPDPVLLGLIRPERHALLGTAYHAAAGPALFPAVRGPGERGLRLLARQSHHAGVAVPRAGLLSL